MTITSMHGKTELTYCSFCGKDEHQVRHLVSGPTVFICNECVGLCVSILERKGIYALSSPPSKKEGER